ncbi:MAG: hypothetical protein FD170_3355 [Bacteroidetes bacterium]|nr:MAG: hypothetical protein FD170_3355 [Bacteroidota bacterium]
MEHTPCIHPDHGACWWVDDEHELCSHCSIEEIATDPATERHQDDPCIISDWNCPYHACMTDHCQGKHVAASGSDFGPGICALKKPEVEDNP